MATRVIPNRRDRIATILAAPFMTCSARLPVYALLIAAFVPDREVGWTISPRFKRQGFAYEAARACLDYVFDTLGWERVIHVIMEGNEPSIALAEKLGSSLQRKQQGIPGLTEVPVRIYGQVNPHK